jgi:signal transduction histidine kinase/ActR/RegA family two-component response regulator
LSRAINKGEQLPDLILQNASGVAVGELAPCSDWSGMSELEHFVQFYETDTFLLDSLAGFIGAGLERGDAGIVVATEAHREALDERLKLMGVDIAAARASGQYVSLDAQGTLAKLTVDGFPDRTLFTEVICDIIERAGKDRGHVRIFGEMVALLWAEGKQSEAIRLEELWNELHKTRSFSLFCGYPMSGFCEQIFTEPLHHVCTAHTRVIPAESYSGIEDADERLRAIIQLQQKARLLEAEIAERKETEVALRSVKEELEVQVEDLRRLHEMSVGLTRTLDIESVLKEVLRAAMDVQHTDMGLLSLCGSERGGLNLHVQSGFDEEFLRQIEWVPPGGGACGTCYEQRRRVVVEDVETDPLFALYREAARDAGFRSCHSTPLITRGGNIIGVLSVHFPEPQRPSERETRLLDLYAQLAADIIENAQLHSRVQRDLEEREQLLVREQTARAEAESANRLKDEFLATVSHELRTPLTAILGWSHMLRKNRLDGAATQRAVQTIERNAQLQAQLVEDILDVSRVIAGKLRLNVSLVDAASVINAAIDSVQPAADSKGIQLEVTLDPKARRIQGDPERLQQVVWNLLSNAIKFTPAGGRARVRLERTEDFVQIKVSDTGCGISKEFLPFIFDRFRQADGTTTRRHGGLGLGLAIVRHLVELHGGTARAESPGEGQGSTFIISLPLSVAYEQGSAGGIGKAHTSRLTGDVQVWPLSSQPSLEGLRVLAVDDDKDTLGMLAVVLAEYKATVQTASSAKEALDMLEWYAPDVLISDVAIPGEDGYSLINRIREREAQRRCKQVQAVALTAYARVEDRVRALSAGFNLFVQKPVDPNELITSIANLVEPGTSGFKLV